MISSEKTLPYTLWDRGFHVCLLSFNIWKQSLQWQTLLNWQANRVTAWPLNMSDEEILCPMTLSDRGFHSLHQSQCRGSLSIGYSPSRQRKHLQRHTHRHSRSRAATQDTEMTIARAGPTATHTHTHIYCDTFILIANGSTWMKEGETWTIWRSGAARIELASFLILEANLAETVKNASSSVKLAIIARH